MNGVMVGFALCEIFDILPLWSNLKQMDTEEFLSYIVFPNV